jgi:hypothetical protein
VHLAQLAGTQVQGTVRVSEAALNELLNSDTSRLRGATLQIAPDNRVVFRHGIVRAAVTLPYVIETGPSPRATLSLASVMVAMALKALLRQPYLQVHGRELTIHLAAVPALERFRPIWPYLRRVAVATERGGLRLHFEFIVTEVSDARMA